MITGTLEAMDGRKLTVVSDGKLINVFLRKGVESNQYLELLQAPVDIEGEEEKGFFMVKEIKPSLPKTAVEKTGPVDMPASANVPKLDFNKAQDTFTGVSTPTGTFTVKDNRSQKDHDIMRQWAMGNVLQSRALANANDAIALNTTQTLERAKKLAEELLKWVVAR